MRETGFTKFCLFTCNLYRYARAGNLARKQNGAYNVLNWGGNLVAVDYKKPYELDPNTLETIGHDASPLSSVGGGYKRR